MPTLKYLDHYPASLVTELNEAYQQGKLPLWFATKYPETHTFQSDKLLYDYVNDLKKNALKKSAPITKVYYDNRQNPIKGTLGTHTYVSRVQGSKLKSSHEIRIASLFREAPLPFLQMIVVHELAHLKEKDHNRAFYQLCCHMLPDYHQLELDVRLWLNLREQKALT